VHFLEQQQGHKWLFAPLLELISLLGKS